MTRPISVDLLTQLRSHQRWIETVGKEGKQLQARGIDLSKLDLSYQNLVEAELPEANFDSAFLQKADLSGAYLAASSFHQARLDEAVVVKADLTDAKLTRASFRSLQGRKTDFMQADLRHADLSNANLLHASFMQANLSEAVLRDALLIGVSFDKANFTGADLTGAHLNGAFLSGVVGIESTKADWIDVGTNEAPRILEGDAVRKWLLDMVSTSVPLRTYPRTLLKYTVNGDNKGISTDFVKKASESPTEAAVIQRQIEALSSLDQ